MKKRDRIPVARPEREKSAFTRIELLAVSVAFVMIVLMVAPTFASNKTDSERLVCFNNLRLIGRAVNMWAGDHDGQTPWRTSVANGGLRPDSGSRPGNAFVDFYFLSNQLATPSILACPSDVGVKKTTDFGEFLSQPFRSSALSYFIGLHSVADSPHSWVSGDRNLLLGPNAACSANVIGVSSISASPQTSVAWTNAVHGEYGHILLMDGSVEFISTPQLRASLLSPLADDNGFIHILKPR